MRTATATVLPLRHRRDQHGVGATRARVRLEPTRRGRLVLSLLAFLLGLLVAAGVLLTVDLPAALAGTESQPPAAVTVEVGDTLWGYAEEHAPAEMSAQEFVDEVRRINQLSTPRVTAGQVLELPVPEDSSR